MIYHMLMMTPGRLDATAAIKTKIKKELGKIIEDFSVKVDNAISKIMYERTVRRPQFPKAVCCLKNITLIVQAIIRIESLSK